MARWKYGSYEFRINPNAAGSSIEVLGDEVRTLTGALISQPTSLRESFSIESVFYQPRTRVISENSLTGDCIDFYNRKIYAVNRANNRIEVYNSNLIFESTISLSAITNKNFKSIDIVPDGIWIHCTNVGVSDLITKINFSGAITVATKTLPVAGGNNIANVEQLSGFFFVVRGNRIEQLSLSTMVKMSEVNAYASAISGLSSDGKYLLLGSNDFSWGNTVYHIDISSGRVINSITAEGINQIYDLAYDGEAYYVFGGGRIQKIKGNSTLIDIYNLEKEIEGNGFVDLQDDIGIINRVAVMSMNKDRVIGHENMFNVSLSAVKVNRG